MQVDLNLKGVLKHWNVLPFYMKLRNKFISNEYIGRFVNSYFSKMPH